MWKLKFLWILSDPFIEPKDPLSISFIPCLIKDFVVNLHRHILRRYYILCVYKYVWSFSKVTNITNEQMEFEVQDEKVAFLTDSSTGLSYILLSIIH